MFQIHTIVEMLKISHQYEIESLELEVTQYLMKSLTIETFFITYNGAKLLSLQDLENKCNQFIHKNGEKIAHNEFLQELSEVTKLSCLVIPQKPARDT